MRPTLISLSIILPMLPFIIILLMGYTTLGIVIISIIGAIGAISLLRNNLHYASWFSLILTSFISILSQGYIPFVFHIALIRISDIPLFNGSIIAPEYSLILAYMDKLYSRYVKEFNLKGFDKKEIESELSALSRSIISIITLAFTLSVIVYIGITKANILSLNPFIALIIFAIIFIIISRYLIEKIRKLES
ncbi:hypothetical protein BFU36_12125 [Sulfolobus sp. A20]|uniref:hypothetical protein n=1 Tax=Saccharolobus sp. A20 TaxID=1891280 RepID=UPI0008461FE8|nr:hypothetical protein [Sulfolobus sp. A20]TRM73520.1 hypothetical protein DJ523_07145 [Sulfolobus sp. E5]TRM75588.1 hypothetical protein DJ532_09770 [Sulfolobus sp. A20-N-F8]TRM78033.1 hypothetical protein DJ528_05635 [Sulfolobus sp. B5]TRM80879.1 hypothetical protein DJ524_06020 [Sulfolobus sp. D5]TRM84738.1 hypothetical protein DJ522_03570 [Sulfolobus sp. F3]